MGSTLLAMWTSSVSIFCVLLLCGITLPTHGEVCNLNCRNGGWCEGNRCHCPWGYTGYQCETREYLCMLVVKCTTYFSEGLYGLQARQQEKFKGGLIQVQTVDLG